MENNLKTVVKEKMAIELSRDKMFAVACFELPAEKEEVVVEKLTTHEIDEVIAKSGIAFGLDKGLIESIYNERINNYKYIIAKGEAPVEGTDAKVVFKVDVNSIRAKKPKINADGTVDLKDLNIVTNTKKMDILATKTPLVLGVNGMNVLGKEVRAPRVKDARLPQGRNTRVLEDGVTLIADIDGQLHYDGHNLYISPAFILDGDVDSAVGNINFVGDVIINGIVRSGFQVQAGGNVEVKGYVEDCTIISGGDIILRYGIQGGGKGKITAKGNVMTKFIQNGNVEAGKDIVAEAIMHSVVAANGNVLVEADKGTIVGGSVSAGNMVSSRIIGSPMSTATEIHIGLNKEVVKAFQSAEANYKKVKQEVEKASQAVVFLSAKDREHKLPLDKAILLEKLKTTKTTLMMQLKEESEKYSELKKIIDNQREGVLKVRDVIYPGTRIIMGKTTLFISDENSYCSFRKDKGEIVRGIY